MNITQILAMCQQESVVLSVEGDKLNASFDARPSDQLIGLIRDNKQALITAILSHKQQSQLAKAKSSIAVQQRHDKGYELSGAQYRLWLAHKLSNNGANYNMPLALKINGRFDHGLAQQAFERVIDKHEGLRTRFVENSQDENNTSQQVRQFIRPTVDFELGLIDGRDLSQEQIQNHIDNMFGYRFDLTNEALVKAALIEVEDLPQPSSILLFVVHHIVCDAWSMGLMIQDFIEFYQQLKQGVAVALPNQCLGYIDYVMWQKAHLTADALDNQLNFWCQQLENAPSVHGLPTDAARSNHASIRGARWQQRFDRSLAERLKLCCQQYGITEFVLIHAAWALSMSLLSGTNDVLIGTPVANRTLPELESMVGVFVNTLALRSNVSFDNTRQYLAAFKQLNTLAQANQDVQFEQVLEALAIKRSHQYSPVFQVMLTVNAAQNNDMNLPDLSFTPVGLSESGNTLAKFELDLTVVFAEQGLQFDWIYDQDLYTQATISQFSLCLHSVLVGLADNSLQPNRLIGPIQQQQLLTRQQGPQVEYDGVTVDVMFARQVALNPNATALSYLDESLSYQQLNLCANRLAHQLIIMNVKHGDCVGIVAPRSIELIVAMLACLKLGAVYVPIDNDYPIARQQFMVQDTNIQLVLHQGEQCELLAEMPQLPSYCLDYRALLTSAPNELVDVDLPQNNQADDLAYVIYTSGSTGQSKGVMVSHKNIWRSVLADDGIDICADDSVAYCANPAFDASTWEIWATLLRGAQLSIISHQQLQDMTLLADYLASQQVSVLQLTSGLFKQIARTMLPQFSRLKYLLIGGDAPDIDAVKYVLKHGAPQHFIHTYGPTETVAFATYYELTAKDLVSTHLPIGKPMANAGAYLLDDNLALRPEGSVVELYLSGDGVAQGYLNRADLTENAFVDNPFGSGKLYKTGDLVRLNADGDLLFHGRIDHQVKVRGFRIEPAEVEQQLNRCDGVESSVVLALNDATGKRLVGYVVVDDNNPLNVENITNQLRQKLPDYMIPSFFVEMESWPLTNNGKIDRRSLPLPQDKGVAGLNQTDYVAPSNEVERKLQQQWGKLLGIPFEQISVEANFFTLGGDSILSIQLTNNAAKLGLHFNPNALFENPTIRGIANSLSDGQQAVMTIDAPQQPSSGKMPLLPVQLAFIQDSQDWHYANQAVLLTVPLDFDANCLQPIVTELYRRHDALRLRYLLEQTDMPYQFSADFMPLSEDMVNRAVSINNNQHQDWSLLTPELNQVHMSMQPQNGEIFKVAYWRASGQQIEAGDGSGRLLLSIHHLSVDTVSWRILVDDLITLYGQYVQGQPLKLAAKTSAYQQWGEYLRQYAQSADLLAQQQYWQAQAGVDVKLLSHQQHQKQLRKNQLLAPSLQQASFSLNRQITTKLTQAGTKVNEILLAALWMAQQQLYGIDQLHVELESHGRHAPYDKLDLTQTLGWFTVSYPLLFAANDVKSLNSRVKAVHAAMAAVPDNGLGYGVHKDILADAKLQTGQKPEWLFNYYGQIEQTIAADCGDELNQFSLAEQSVGQVQSLKRQGHYPLQFEAQINQSANGDKTLNANISYCASQYDKQVIEQLMQRMEQLLSYFEPQVSSQLLSQLTVQLNQNQSPDLPLLFAIHPFSGRVDCYRTLAEQLSPVAKVVGVQAPFVSGARMRFDQITTLADWYAKAIVLRQPQGPYRLFGWSAGGQLAYFVAQSLQQLGHEVDYLNMVEPMLPENDEMTVQSAAGVDAISVNAKVDYIKFLLGFIGLEDPVVLQSLDAIDSDASFATIVTQAVNLLMAQNIAELDDPELIETILLAGVDYRTAYRPATKLTGIANTRLFNSSTSSEQGYFDLWGDWLTDVTTDTLIGEHQTLLSEPTSLKMLVERLTEDLQQV